MSAGIVALVLSYRYPAGITALSKCLAAANIDMIVHVDAKIDESPFHKAAKAGNYEVHFIQDRVRIFWRGFTMVEAAISLLRAARARGGYNQFLLISDDSLPLIGPAELRRRLESGGDFIASRPANDDGLRLRYERSFMLDSEATQVRWIPVIDREVTDDALQRFARLGALRKRGKKPLHPPYHGSQWMALTSTSADKILASWEGDIWLRESFEFSEVPDEGYFQTILSEQEVPAWRPLMYADWSVPSPPRIFRTPDELSQIDTGGALFVRKIDFNGRDLNSWTDRLLQSN
jgi:hypothetical protein